MAVLQVVVNENNEVLGTLMVDVPAKGEGAPARFGALARPGQRVLQVTVDDSLLELQPDALHAAIKADHLG
jgi:hypothetical protein